MRAAAVIADDPPKPKSGGKGPRGPRGTRTFRVVLDPTASAKLMQEAEKRQVEPEVLASAISRVVVNDDLIDAVLDDAEQQKINNSAALK